MNLDYTFRSDNSHIALEKLVAAREQLLSSSRGARAVKAIAEAEEALSGLDSENQMAVIILVRGIFTHPGSSRDVLSAASY